MMGMLYEYSDKDLKVIKLKRIEKKKRKLKTNGGKK